jgi:hypothetical protein
MSSRRYIIEGTWTGYSSHQQRVVHRTVHKAAEKKLRAWAEKTYGVLYTDGTRLLLNVRDCKPRERVEVIAGYSGLIAECMRHDVASVADLPERAR